MIKVPLNSLCDQIVFEKVYKQYSKDLYRFLTYSFQDKTLSKDITQNVFPQEAFKKFLFNKSVKTDNFRLVNNPYMFNYRSQEIIVSSGIEVQNAMKFCNRTHFECMIRNIESGHLSPGYPDILR